MPRLTCGKCDLFNLKPWKFCPVDVVARRGGVLIRCEWEECDYSLAQLQQAQDRFCDLTEKLSRVIAMREAEERAV